nr:E3 ubiquitin-protein ligase TRIM39-like [Pelodiscus sinensis]|eukprot:XP_006124861.2 E3 ubiquitin-protein ligase TRIM39-like [Pelodiscus sinensis]
MAAGDLAGSFQDEVTCPICLEYFTDPVITDCGHNFCRACLSWCWRELEPKFSCPQCRETILRRHLRPNRQLGNLVELVKRLRLPAGPGPEGQPGCERHQEALKLFCQEDQAPICVICRESREHRAHTAVPIEEAAQEYKEKLQRALGPLREQLEEALVLRIDEEEKTTEWQVGVWVYLPEPFPRQRSQGWGMNPVGTMSILVPLPVKARSLLKEKLQRALGPLREQLEEALVLRIDEEEKTTEWQLLKDAKSTLSRSENMKLQEPEAACTDLQCGYKICLDLREALNRFAVNVTLDPSTANPWLVLSADRKRVRCGDTYQALPSTPERFKNYPTVLGAEGFAGGRCYWEVEVGDKPEWNLGVCRESVSRKEENTLSPEDGYWVVCQSEGEYLACTSPSTPLPMSSRPSRVGIFLDYEAGEVSFYNVTDRSHLFTFTDTFSGTLRPYFYPGLYAGGTNTDPLTICLVPAQDGGNPSSVSGGSREE